MLGFQGVTFVLALGLLSAASAAQAGDCTSTLSCYHAAMPLYNQNDPSLGSYWLPNGPEKSMLCGPTSGSMALQAVYGNLWRAERAKVAGWTLSSFAGRTPVQQIQAMAGKMGTSPTGGSWFVPIWDLTSLNYVMNSLPYLAQSAGNFPVTGGSGGYVSGWGPVVDVDRYASHLQATHKSADIIVHGDYTRHTSCFLGACASYFTRDGGHIVAISGYETINGIKNVVINDPWYAHRENHVFGQVYAVDGWTVTVLPKVGIQSSYLYRSGSHYRIIDGELGIWAGNSNGPEPVQILVPTMTLIKSSTTSGMLAP